MGALKIQIIY